MHINIQYMAPNLLYSFSDTVCFVYLYMACSSWWISLIYVSTTYVWNLHIITCQNCLGFQKICKYQYPCWISLFMLRAIVCLFRICYLYFPLKSTQGGLNHQKATFNTIVLNGYSHIAWTLNSDIKDWTIL